MPSFRAYSGFELPAIGFGTYKLNGQRGVDAIKRAIANGYTLLDSAFNYENEGAVGRAVRESGRDDLIVTSKLPGRHHANDEALETIEESLARTGLDALDLYLIHWPNPKQGKYVDAWRALIEARERGLLRHIGVCNFLPEHLDVLERETGVLPEVNQIEIHPYFPQVEAVQYDADKGILTQAWSPIGRGNDLLEQGVIVELAGKYGVSPAAVVLAWHVARGVIALPKASSDEHQLGNLKATELTLAADEVAAITALGRPDGRLNNQDPAVYEEF